MILQIASKFQCMQPYPRILVHLQALSVTEGAHDVREDTSWLLVFPEIQCLKDICAIM